MRRSPVQNRLVTVIEVGPTAEEGTMPELDMQPSTISTRKQPSKMQPPKESGTDTFLPITEITENHPLHEDDDYSFVDPINFKGYKEETFRLESQSE